MTQSWHDVLFAHWRIDVGELRRAVPPHFELDLFEGTAWLSIVAFLMSNVAPRATPALPWLSRFPEINVRTYVRAAGRPGVYFFSLDAAQWLAVATARVLFNLPYYIAEMTIERHADCIDYRSSRRTGGPARFEASYESFGEPFEARPGSLEYFLTERYCLYHQRRGGLPYRLDIHHRPWSLQEARADIRENSMAAASNLTIAGGADLLHYARRIDALAWAPSLIGAPSARKPVPSPAT